jgi:diadenosine tetraphosphate (Ap4A) HIT family hydrolase
MISSFEPPKHLVILETEHWMLSHRVDSALPGYLILGARKPTKELSLMPPGALIELGTLLAQAQKALDEILRPQHLYIGRYGHTLGHALHFHIIPICEWVRQSFFNDPRYRVLRNFDQPFEGADAADKTDGVELTLYVWREFCENPVPPPISGPPIHEVVAELKVFTAVSGKPDAGS